MEYIFSRMTKRSTRSEIRDLLKWTRRPEVISFGGGLPDPSLFPIAEIVEITREVLEKKGYMALQYGPTLGEGDFIQAVVAHMAAYGETVATDGICTVSSSQQALDLISMLFLDEGDSMILEVPSYVGAIQAFRRSGADMHGVPMDDEGIRIDRLEAKLDMLSERGRTPRFLYVIPDFQNPSGISLSLERRRRLLEIAAEKQIPIIEDSPYRELRFDSEPLPSLWTLSGGRGVVELKTFSKMLFPGMRLGWINAEHEVIEQVEKLKQSVDLCSPPFNQLILAEFIRRGKMKATMARAIECYRGKRDAMLKALERYMPPSVTWSRPEGGMFLWVSLPQGFDATEFLPVAAAKDVAFVTGRAFHFDGSGAETLRLNYSFPSIGKIETGIRRLSEAIRVYVAA